MSGAGNSFWITHFIPPTSLSPVNINWQKIVQHLCQRQHNNVYSSDGLVALFPSKTCDLKWLFYNADGSLAEMCGNAACCVIDYAFKKKLIPSTQSFVTLETLNQKITGKLKNGSPCIFLKQSKEIQGPFNISFEKEKISYMFLNSSVPHAVIELKQWPNTDQEWENKKKLGKSLREKTTHYKNGMNVSFYCPEKQNIFSSTTQEEIVHHQTSTLFARSFERGIEDFTPACGTGALAVAQVYRHKNTFLSSILVQMPGGKLKVEFHQNKKISLMSPVKQLHEIEEMISTY